MSDIASRLRKAMAEQREGRPGLRRAGADTETAMRPVREAAEELRAELAHVPQVAIHTDPDAVWIEGLVQTCARCAVLAEPAERLGPAPARDPRSG